MGNHLSREEAERIISNLEEKGEDSSTLKQALEETYGQKSQTPEISDDEYVSIRMEYSTFENGAGLKCGICGNESPSLYSGACESCFRSWALSTRKEKRR